MRKKRPAGHGRIPHGMGRIIVLVTIAALLLFSGKAYAETRLYHLRVTLRSGERYETISSSDPMNYCHLNGGSVHRVPGRYLFYSPRMKVKALRTWIEPGPDLAGRWRDVLRANNLLASRNHKKLQGVGPLALEDMMTPE